MSAFSDKNGIWEGKGLDLGTVPAVLINFVEYLLPCPRGSNLYNKVY